MTVTKKSLDQQLSRFNLIAKLSSEISIQDRIDMLNAINEYPGVEKIFSYLNGERNERAQKTLKVIREYSGYNVRLGAHNDRLRRENADLEVEVGELENDLTYLNSQIEYYKRYIKETFQHMMHLERSEILQVCRAAINIVSNRRAG